MVPQGICHQDREICCYSISCGVSVGAGSAKKTRAGTGGGPGSRVGDQRQAPPLPWCRGLGDSRVSMRPARAREQVLTLRLGLGRPWGDPMQHTHIVISPESS